MAALVSPFCRQKGNPSISPCFSNWGGGGSLNSEVTGVPCYFLDLSWDWERCLPSINTSGHYIGHSTFFLALEAHAARCFPSTSVAGIGAIPSLGTSKRKRPSASPVHTPRTLSQLLCLHPLDPAANQSLHSAYLGDSSVKPHCSASTTSAGRVSVEKGGEERLRLSSPPQQHGTPPVDTRGHRQLSASTIPTTTPRSKCPPCHASQHG